MKVGFITWRFFDFDGKGDRFAGGIETYLENLSLLCHEMGWSPIIFQAGNREFQLQAGPAIVLGVTVPNASGSFRRKRNILYEVACRYIDIQRDLLIFGGDQWSVPNAPRRSIAIQHGIAWDYSGRGIEYSRRWLAKTSIGASLKKTLLRWTAIRDFGHCPNRVCVDYCFPIWYKEQNIRELNGHTWVIPNFGNVAERSVVENRSYSNSDIGLIYARRFEVGRGVKMMAHVAMRLLKIYSNIYFTFAGNGGLEQWLRYYFRNESRVTITKYLPEQSQDLHLRHQIAVIPSLASEGTSLSVAEAMGAGCAVVATAVGGITNMILDGFNGIFVDSTEESLHRGLSRLITDRVLRSALGHRGYETAACTFSVERWKNAWRNVLETVASS
jgi:glycosyltransferase involved in cell wall biosynthesis